MLRILLILPLLVGPVANAQVLSDIDTTGLTLDNFNESTLDRFGNPTFGLRAQREPELRRLRKMAGRPILEGRISIYEMSEDDIDELYEKLNQ